MNFLTHEGEGGEDSGTEVHDWSLPEFAIELLLRNWTRGYQTENHNATRLRNPVLRIHIVFQSLLWLARVCGTRFPGHFHVWTRWQRNTYIRALYSLYQVLRLVYVYLTKIWLSWMKSNVCSSYCTARPLHSLMAYSQHCRYNKPQGLTRHYWGMIVFSFVGRQVRLHNRGAAVCRWREGVG